MAGINKSIILGRLGKNPELTYTQSGTAVCKFSIATSRKQKDGNEVTQWHRCVAWQKAAEIINQYVKKGDQLYVEGEINYGKYDKDGVTHYTTDIIVREFNFIGGNQQGQQNQNQRPQQNQGYQGNQNQQQPQQGYQPQNQSYQNAPMGKPQSGYSQGPQGGQTPPKDDGSLIPF